MFEIGRSVVLKWVSSHIGIVGIKQADRLARFGSASAELEWEQVP